ncbi:chemotaxis protein CheW [Helicobacter enhydrae]|uniref:Chemotaxis protein CheW n=1 Tax=Helicobacter enhydrae TaxID=222136 RepID=A0A1B1U6V3_9HELI|nr:chemotaxis protein CheW [Helicobacter enhydrae]ANV98415.1 chemotaxis protein CheW [Helicobacter enhydrae]
MNNDKLREIFQQQITTSKDSSQTTLEKTLQVIGFIVGDEEFAVPILNVREIVKPIEYTRVPGTPEYVLGVFNLRGNVLPLIDLRQKFGLERKRFDADTRFLVINHQDQIAGFVIDCLTEAIHIKESEIDYTVTQESKEDYLIYGIGKQEDKLITILKIDVLMKQEF